MMDESGLPILSLVVFLPLVGALMLLMLRNVEAVRWAALGATVVALVASLPLWSGFDRASHAFQFVERYDWIPTFNIEYSMGVDGISLLLVLLTTFLSPIVVLCSWRAIDKRVKEFMASILLMETAMLGVFVALDFVLFYVFWEAMLIPMYLIIGVWGGPNRIYAAIKFFLYTLAGSLLLLIAMIALYFAGGHTFSIPALMGQA
jgi:NADH-quinone oxidoreductase subunit M